MVSKYKKGVSVVICCFNSTARLYKTLKALAHQIIDKEIDVELIIVDNASTDETATYAKEIWESFNSPWHLINTYEAQPGLGNARKKGIAEANYAYILFCDDDNWLSPNYVTDAYHILNNDTTIAACGGIGLPVFETEKPYWFDEYAESYALGSQEIVRENGKLLCLYGAGLVFKKEIINQLDSCGYTQFFKGRVGKKLSSSEDIELTNAMVIMGYKLHYNPSLQFYHYLPKERLTLNYIQKLFIANGTDGPIRNLYYAHICTGLVHKLIKNWYFHLLLSMFRLVKYFIIPPKKYGRKIYFLWNKAYINELLSIKYSYKNIISNIGKIASIAIEKNNTNNTTLAQIA